MTRTVPTPERSRVPTRTCIGCSTARPSDQLTRVARVGDRLAVGRDLPGRGAWLCTGSPSCVEAAVRRRAFARAFRGPVDPAAVAALAAELGVDAAPEPHRGARAPR